jgi:hypothetical protein
VALTSGTRIGRYEIVGKVGEGGMGEVYRAHDTRLGRDVAIKVLPSSFADDLDRRTRFEREAQAIAALSHPNVLAIHDTGTHDGQMFLVMELLHGDIDPNDAIDTAPGGFMVVSSPASGPAFRLDRVDIRTGARTLVANVSLQDRVGLVGITATSVVGTPGHYGYAYSYARRFSTLLVASHAGDR